MLYIARHSRCSGESSSQPRPAHRCDAVQLSNFRIDCCQRLPSACCNSIRCMLCVASLSHVLSTAVRRTYVVLSVQLLRSAGVEGAALEQETDDDWSLAFEDVLILYADSLKSPAKGKPRDPFRTLVEEVFSQLDTVRLTQSDRNTIFAAVCSL